MEKITNYPRNLLDLAEPPAGKRWLLATQPGHHKKNDFPQTGAILADEETEKRLVGKHRCAQVLDLGDVRRFWASIDRRGGDGPGVLESLSGVSQGMAEKLAQTVKGVKLLRVDDLAQFSEDQIKKHVTFAAGGNDAPKVYGALVKARRKLVGAERPQEATE